MLQGYTDSDQLGIHNVTTDVVHMRVPPSQSLREGFVEGTSLIYVMPREQVVLDPDDLCNICKHMQPDF